MQVVDIQKLLASQPGGSFVDLCRFNEQYFGSCCITGVSPVWEMHPDTDEFFHVLQGELDICLLQDAGAEQVSVAAGQVYVVPRGV